MFKLRMEILFQSNSDDWHRTVKISDLVREKIFVTLFWGSEAWL
jgi:hypothetical protein